LKIIGNGGQRHEALGQFGIHRKCRYGLQRRDSIPRY
jgi:hypothetical protein